MKDWLLYLKICQNICQLFDADTNYHENRELFKDFLSGNY